MKNFLFIFIFLFLSACGVSWVDSRGTQHVLGFGYMAIPRTETNNNVFVRGADILGLGLINDKNIYITFGFLRTRSVSIAEDFVVQLPCGQCSVSALEETEIRRIK